MHGRTEFLLVPIVFKVLTTALQHLRFFADAPRALGGGPTVLLLVLSYMHTGSSSTVT
jgi:hypothetical protein